MERPHSPRGGKAAAKSGPKRLPQRLLLDVAVKVHLVEAVEFVAEQAWFRERGRITLKDRSDLVYYVAEVLRGSNPELADALLTLRQLRNALEHSRPSPALIAAAHDAAAVLLFYLRDKCAPGDLVARCSDLVGLLAAQKERLAATKRSKPQSNRGDQSNRSRGPSNNQPGAPTRHGKALAVVKDDAVRRSEAAVEAANHAELAAAERISRAEAASLEALQGAQEAARAAKLAALAAQEELRAAREATRLAQEQRLAEEQRLFAVQQQAAVFAAQQAAQAEEERLRAIRPAVAAQVVHEEEEEEDDDLDDDDNEEIRAGSFRAQLLPQTKQCWHIQAIKEHQRRDLFIGRRVRVVRSIHNGATGRLLRPNGNNMYFLLDDVGQRAISTQHAVVLLP